MQIIANNNIANSRNFKMAAMVFLLASLLFASPQKVFCHEVFNRKTPVVLAVENVGPTVVSIYTEETSRHPENPFRNFGEFPLDKFFSDVFPPGNSKRQNLGSGVIIDPQGYIITNEHVVTRATRIKATLIDKREFPARLIGADAKSDIAIVKIDSDKPLPFVEMGKSDDLMIGETVLAIGNPYGLQHTVTQGIVSALNRTIRAGKNIVYNDFIQVDASINPGNSGGPLLNINGELIGINAAIYQGAEGIGFAIPINHAKRIANDLIHFGKVRRGWLGVTVRDMSDNLLQQLRLDYPHGVVVARVFAESPAASAGIRQGDVVLSIGGHDVKNRADYQQSVSSYTLNDTFQIGLLRDGKKKTVDLKLSSIPKARAADFALHWLGIRVKNITREVAPQIDLAANKGVVVVQVDPNGPSGEVGIKPGGTIRQINQQSIDNEEDFENAVVEAGKMNSVLLLVQRGRAGYYVTLEP